MSDAFEKPSPLSQQESAPVMSENTSESEESLDQRERALKREIAQEVAELNTTVEDLSSLAEDESLTLPLRERLLSAIDKVGNSMQTTFMIKFGGAAVMEAILGFQEYMMQTGNSAIESGSILGHANEVALAAVAVYASIKGVQFVNYKVRERMAKSGIKEESPQGVVDAASFLTSHRENAGLEYEELGISSGEHRALHRAMGHTREEVSHFLKQ